MPSGRKSVKDMSDAYMCDRCGTFFEGDPEMVIQVKGGGKFPWGGSEAELCGSCSHQMQDWWVEPKVSREG